jgi:hypothetical protein
MGRKTALYKRKTWTKHRNYLSVVKGNGVVLAATRRFLRCFWGLVVTRND